jgi:hypothetical protein
MEDMKNVKMKVTHNTQIETVTCHEMVCDPKAVSAQVSLSDIKNLFLGQTYELEYEYDDLVTKCYKAKIVKYQIDDEFPSRSFIKFIYESTVVSKSKFKVLKETVSTLLNGSESRLICLNLDRHAGHTSTLLWLLNKDPDAILLVQTLDLKERAKRLAHELQLYDVRTSNIVVVNDKTDLSSLFEGRKFSKILIDDFSLFTKTRIGQIFYNTRYDESVRYVCLG